MRKSLLKVKCECLTSIWRSSTLFTALDGHAPCWAFHNHNINILISLCQYFDTNHRFLTSFCGKAYHFCINLLFSKFWRTFWGHFWLLKFVFARLFMYLFICRYKEISRSPYRIFGKSYSVTKRLKLIGPPKLQILRTLLVWNKFIRGALRCRV